MKFGTLPSFGEITEIILHDDSNYHEINDTKSLVLKLSERILEILRQIITSLITPRSWSTSSEASRASRSISWCCGLLPDLDHLLLRGGRCFREPIFNRIFKNAKESGYYNYPNDLMANKWLLLKPKRKRRDHKSQLIMKQRISQRWLASKMIISNCCSSKMEKQLGIDWRISLGET